MSNILTGRELTVNEIGDYLLVLMCGDVFVSRRLTLSLSVILRLFVFR